MYITHTYISIGREARTLARSLIVKHRVLTRSRVRRGRPAYSACPLSSSCPRGIHDHEGCEDRPSLSHFHYPFRVFHADCRVCVCVVRKTIYRDAEGKQGGNQKKEEEVEEVVHVVKCRREKLL